MLVGGGQWLVSVARPRRPSVLAVWTIWLCGPRRRARAALLPISDGSPIAIAISHLFHLYRSFHFLCAFPIFYFILFFDLFCFLRLRYSLGLGSWPLGASLSICAGAGLLCVGAAHCAHSLAAGRGTRDTVGVGAPSPLLPLSRGWGWLCCSDQCQCLQ